MLLIADSGSTKTDWALVTRNKRQLFYSTIGYNPYFLSSDVIRNSISEKLIPLLSRVRIKKIYFYGAGCSSGEKSKIVKEALGKCFKKAEINVSHDLLAAAYALLGNQPGFAAILGTGSNTCIYNGKEIVKNIDSLGYLLGDEGSGSSIAKKIVRDFMRGYLPSDLQQKFSQAYNLNNEKIYNTLYTELLPNRFLADFCKFAGEHKDHQYVRKIVTESFNDFFKNLVCMYPDYQKFSFNCVGSVGYIFKDRLKEVAACYNMKLGNLLHSPIHNLTNYHLLND